MDNLTTPLGDLTVGGATGSVDVTSVSDRKEGEGTDMRCEFWGAGSSSSYMSISSPVTELR